MTESIASKFYKVLGAAGVDYRAASWGQGFNLFGDDKSINEAMRLLNADQRAETLKNALCEGLASAQRRIEALEKLTFKPNATLVFTEKVTKDAEERPLPREPICRGQEWLHTKSKRTYVVEMVSIDTETGDHLVNYRLNGGLDTWTRRESQFLDSGGPCGALRFQRIS